MRFAVPAVLAVSALACFLATPARAQEKPTIAVLPLRVEGLQLNEIQRINVQMRARASSRGGYDVQSEGDTTQLVEASQSLGLDCDVNAVACGVRLGQIADVAYVLVGRATGGLDGHVGLDASLIDVKAGGAVRRVSALVPADVTRQSEAMNAFADSLFAKRDPSTGTVVGAPLVTLALQVEPAGADIIVDGAKRGVSPMAEPVDSLMPGDHHVTVQKKGYLAYRSRLSVLTGEAATLQITLAVDPNAMRKKPTGLEAAAPWITTGVGAVALVGGGIAAGFAGNQYLVFREAADNIAAIDTTELDDGELEDIRLNHEVAERAAGDWQSWGQPMFAGGLVAASIGLVVTAGGVVWGLVMMEDVEGASDDAAAPATTAPSR